MQSLLIKKKRKIEIVDIVVVAVMTIWALLIVIPFYNVIIISISSQAEYLKNPFELFPLHPTLDSFKQLLQDPRIWIGFRTTGLIVLLGVPINLFVTTSLGYGLSRRFPGRKFIMLAILFTMLFNGGIIPMYMLMKQMNLIDTIWSVILAYGVNTFYMIIALNYFASLPESLIESARLDGAGEWKILFRIILPLSAPIIATITLFYVVDRWNEWYNAMIFIRDAQLQPLQLVLRNIVINSEMAAALSSTGAVSAGQAQFTMGLKMAAVIVTMLPVMCVFPFLQKHFVKGIMVGAIKS